jgi:hypothetical protein
MVALWQALHVCFIVTWIIDLYKIHNVTLSYDLATTKFLSKNKKKSVAIAEKQCAT